MFSDISAVRISAIPLPLLQQVGLFNAQVHDAKDVQQAALCVQRADNISHGNKRSRADLMARATRAYLATEARLGRRLEAAGEEASSRSTRAAYLRLRAVGFNCSERNTSNKRPASEWQKIFKFAHGLLTVYLRFAYGLLMARGGNMRYVLRFSLPHPSPTYGLLTVYLRFTHGLVFGGLGAQPVEPRSNCAETL